MLQAVIDNPRDDRLADEARTAMEVSHLYGLLAALFRSEPTAELLGALRAPDLAPLLAESGLDLGVGEQDGADDDALLQELAVEYAALFLGPGGHISPHESVHADPSGGRLFGDETVAVKRFIEALELEVNETYRGLPDHISVEFELMATLAVHEARGWREDDMVRAANALAYQQDFMQGHLLRWVPLFCDKITETAELAFYRGVARMTHDFLIGEVDDLQRRLALAGIPGV